MGTEIYLMIGNVTLDWSKNNRGNDHGILFQEDDRTHIHTEELDYDYCEEHGIETEPIERALVRSLKSTIPRIELLGFTVPAVEVEYKAHLTNWLELQEEIEGVEIPSPLQFSEFIEFLERHPLRAIVDEYAEGFDSEETKRVASRFTCDPAFHRIPNSEGASGYSEAGYFSSLIRILHPYSLMRLLALVPENLTSNIVWHYGLLVDNGWAKEEEFVPEARRNQTFLIATEGSSDVHILKHALTLLRPEVQDFFRFIDVSGRHPFSGTGSLTKFAEGLVKIDVQNQILFLFDNDAEGWAAFEEVQKYKLPPNMRAMVLPELDQFKQFETLGPQGVYEGDINRRAAAIECYLDLRLKNKPPARVLWTNYKKERKDYQGSLEYKDTYMSAFMEQTQQTLTHGNYDVSKIRILLDSIYNECCMIATCSQIPKVSPS